MRWAWTGAMMCWRACTWPGAGVQLPAPLVLRVRAQLFLTVDVTPMIRDLHIIIINNNNSKKQLDTLPAQASMWRTHLPTCSCGTVRVA